MIPMPNMGQARGFADRFFGWARQTMNMLCMQPDHLQRLGIIGAGFVVQLTMWAAMLIVWRGYDRTPELQAQSLNFMGWSLMGSMALWGLVVVSLLGTVKGLKIAGPGGFGLDLLTTADDPDAGPEMVRDIHVHERTGPVTEPVPTPPVVDTGKSMQVSD